MDITKPDARFSTSYTNLAACIGSLKIPVKSEDPVTIVEDNSTGKRVVSFWFEDEGAEAFCGSVHNPRQIQRYWDNRQQFEIANPNHPLIPMRKALEKRDWLAHVFHGRIMPASSLQKTGFRTREIILAATLMAAGYPLIRLDKPNYLFGKIPPKVFEEFDRFESPEYIERPVSLMRRALEARKLLVDFAKHPDIQIRVKFVDGHIDQDAGRMAFIPKGASDQEVSRSLDILYSPR